MSSTTTDAAMEVVSSPPDIEKIKLLSNDEMTRLIFMFSIIYY